MENFFLDVVIPSDVRLPLWIAAVGFLSNVLINILKPFIPLLQERQKQDKKILENKIANLEEKLLSCEKETLENKILASESNEKIAESNKKIQELEMKYIRLVDRIDLLRRLQEGTEFDDLLSKIQDNDDV